MHGDQIYMAVCFYNLVNIDLSMSSVRYCTVTYTGHFSKGTRTTRPCLSGQMYPSPSLYSFSVGFLPSRVVNDSAPSCLIHFMQKTNMNSMQKTNMNLIHKTNMNFMQKTNMNSMHKNKHELHA